MVHPLQVDPVIHPATLPIDQLLQQCQIQTGRRSGPGGQHRNKVETAVVIKHIPTGIVGQASECRSQAANKEEAIQRLRLNLAVQLRNPTADSEKCDSELREAELGADTTPALSNQMATFQWSSRIQKGKILVSKEHQDYPAVIAGVLDALSANDWNPNLVAEQFDTSSSQLIKVLRSYAPALEVLNRNRVEIGLSKLF